MLSDNVVWGLQGMCVCVYVHAHKEGIGAERIKKPKQGNNVINLSSHALADAEQHFLCSRKGLKHGDPLCSPDLVV